MSIEALHMLWAAACIGILVVLVSAFGLHPFLALIVVALSLGLGCGLPFTETVGQFQKGFGDVMSFVGIVVGLGTMLGVILVRSGGADALANALARAGKPETVGYRVFLASILVGLPLFFEVGFVLLVPIAFALAREMQISILRVGLPMLAGLSVAHALVPPHPAPTLAVASLHADIGKTILLAIVLGIPIGLLCGPVFAKVAERWVPHLPPPPLLETPEDKTGDPAAANRPKIGSVVFCILLPVALMLAKSLVDTTTDKGAAIRGVTDFVGNPIMALFLAVLASVFLLGIRQGTPFKKVNQLMGAGLGDIAAIILVVGAGGGLKQMLIATKVAATMGAWATSAHLSPLLLGWMAAVLVRIATGSATVATITASGIMAPIVETGGVAVSRELLVLAIGCGSVILSHVNDAGFWLVKEYFRMTVPQTFKTWSMMETLIAVIGISLIMLCSLFV